MPLSGRTDRGIATSLFGLHGIDDSDVNWQRFRGAYVARLPEHLPRLPGTVLPGVFELLALLQTQADTAVGLLTGNVSEGARIKLEHYGIQRYFAFGGFGDVHGHRDDVARAALAAARGHVPQAFSTDRVWVIGATPLDVRCARAIGARAVAVATGVFTAAELAPDEPDLLVNDLSNTASLAERLLS